MFKIAAAVALLFGSHQALAQTPVPINWMTCQISPEGSVAVVGMAGPNAYRQYDGVVSPLVSRTSGNVVETVQVLPSSVIWTISSNGGATFVRTFDFPNRRFSVQVTNSGRPVQPYQSDCRVGR